MEQAGRQSRHTVYVPMDSGMVFLYLSSAVPVPEAPASDTGSASAREEPSAVYTCGRNRVGAGECASALNAGHVLPKRHQPGFGSCTSCLPSARIRILPSCRAANSHLSKEHRVGWVGVVCRLLPLQRQVANAAGG